MWQNDQFKDWLFRYQYIYRLRNTDKNKTRFLNALSMDVLKLRKDIQIIEYQISSRQTLKNIYIGNLSKAEKVICTYYDTPLSHFGTYNFFDPLTQKKKTLSFTLFFSFIMILVGIVGMICLLSTMKQQASVFSIKLFAILFLALVYFYLLSKVSKGQLNYHTLIRNTSSVLTILSLIKKEKNNVNIAFAFIDRGTTIDQGFYFLEDIVSQTTDLILLDSVGAPAPINKISRVSNHTGQKFTYIFSARKNQRNGKLFLTQKDLKQKQLNFKNLTEVIQILDTF